MLDERRVDVIPRGSSRQHEVREAAEHPERQVPPWLGLELGNQRTVG
jgi:hypothetical protein